jgi:hypothetical protein
MVGEWWLCALLRMHRPVWTWWRYPTPIAVINRF